MNGGTSGNTTVIERAETRSPRCRRPFGGFPPPAGRREAAPEDAVDPLDGRHVPTCRPSPSQVKNPARAGVSAPSGEGIRLRNGPREGRLIQRHAVRAFRVSGLGLGGKRTDPRTRG